MNYFLIENRTKKKKLVDLCYEKEAAHFYRGRPATLAFSRSAPLTQLSTRLPPPSPPTAVQLLSAPTCSAAQKIYPARILPWSQGRSVLPRLLPTCQAVQPPSPTLPQPLSLRHNRPSSELFPSALQVSESSCMCRPKEQRGWH